MVTKINVASVVLPPTVFVPDNNSHRPMNSLPLKQVTGYEARHQPCSWSHGGPGDFQSFVAEVKSVGEFLGSQPNERAISMSDLLSAFLKDHSLLTLEQALRLFRTCDDELPASLALIPTREEIMVPEYPDPAFLARGVEYGRKRLCKGSFVRHYQTGLVLLSSRVLFTEDTVIVGISR